MGQYFSLPTRGPVLVFARQVLAGDRFRFLTARYATAGLAAIETIVIAGLLAPQAFGQYALVIQGAAWLAFTVAGSASGYVLSFFGGRRASLERVYFRGATRHYAGGVIVGGAALALWNPLLGLSALLFAVTAVQLVFEPVLRVRNQFNVAVLPKALASLGVIIAVLATSAAGGLTLTRALAIAVTINTAATGVYVWYVWKTHGRVLLGSDTSPAAAPASPSYWGDIVRPGLPVAFSGALFLVFSSLDRLFISRYHDAALLGAYGLGWQLAQGGLLLTTSMNVISGVRIGEAMQRGNADLVASWWRQITFTTVAALLTIPFVGVAAWVLPRLGFSSYADSTWVSLAIVCAYASYSVAGSVTSLLTYVGSTNVLNVGYSLAIVASVAVNVLAVARGWTPWVPLVSTIVILFVLDCVLIAASYRVARSAARAPDQ